jgi:hypothetical protein
MSQAESPLLEALLAAQREMPALKKTATNPHFKSKFAPLDTIVETVNPVLHKHGLTWSTLPGHDEYGPALTYRLAHAPSGESIEGRMPLLLAKPDAQGMGSAITYARRYALCAVLNLVSDDDDDGSGAAAANANRSSAPAWAEEASTERKQIALDSLTFLVGDPDVARDGLVAVKDALGVVPEGIAVALSRIARVVQEKAAA